MRPMRRIARASLRLYPRSWRDRYGEELLGLLDEMRVTPADVVDLLNGAARSRLMDLPGGVVVSDSQARWLSRALGVASLAIVLPVALFVVLNLLRYQFGLFVGESSECWIDHSSGAAELLGYIGGPLLALGVAALGMGRLITHRDDGGALLISLRVQPSRLALIAAAVSLAVLAVIVGYGVSENLLEALR
jgi:hypothetical protein